MKKMTKKKIRRCNRRFFTVYGTLLVIAALAVVFGYSYIRTLLTEYESVQTKYVAEDAFQMFKNLDYDALFAYEKPENQALTHAQQYRTHVDGLLAGKEITYRDSYKGDGEGEKIYNVYADGKRFANFTIRLSGEKTAHGFEKWGYETASINLLENAFHEYQIECFEGNQLMVDGVEVPFSQMTEIGKLEGYERHLAGGLTVPRQYAYTVKDKLEAPRVSVRLADGSEQVIEADAQGRYVIGYPYQDEQFKAEREAWIRKTAESISVYTLRRVSLNTIARRVDPDSVAYEYISKIDTSIVFPHKGYRFENVRTENYVQFSDECFGVDIYYDFVVDYYEQPKTHETAYRFFFHKVNGNWMLYDFTTI